MLRYGLSVPVAMFMNLFVYATCWLWAGLSLVFWRDGMMPRPLFYLSTHDGLDGGQKQLGWPKVTGIKLFKQRVIWLCRNCAVMFHLMVLGIDGKGAVVEGNTDDTPETRISGGLRYTIVTPRGRYFGYRRDIGWTEKKYMKLWFGWHYRPHDGFHQFKFMINPWKTQVAFGGG